MQPVTYASFFKGDWNPANLLVQEWEKRIELNPSPRLPFYHQTASECDSPF